MDPLALLRQLYADGKLGEVREEGGNIIVGDLAWPREAKTNFKIRG